MSEQTSDPWREIIREAIDSTNLPIVGSKFRGAIDLAAAKRNLRFPPENEPELRLVQLLERYSDIVSILRRPRQDFLVAPTGREDLLAKGIQERLFGIRQDLFNAFTFISERQPYYDRTTDSVVWQKNAEKPVVCESWVPIERATNESEGKVRKEFIEGLKEPARSQLLEALKDLQPLQAFGKAVKDVGAQKEWHSFRTERLLEKIQRWASDRKIDWKDAWLTQGRTSSTVKRLPSLPEVVEDTRGESAERDSIRLLLAGLDAADIQRISIPLDLVLKALSSSRK